MFETKENTSGEIKFTTFLDSGREPCQQAVQDFLGECLFHISNFFILVNIVFLRYPYTSISKL